MPGPYLNQGIFRTAVNQIDATPQEELGVWRFEAGKILRYVKANPTNGTIQAGAAVRADFPIVTAVLAGNQVAQCSGVTDMFLGIAEVTIAAGNFGWITCYGPATAMVISATIPGSGLAPSSTTSLLGIAATCNYNAVGLTIQTGLSAGSSIFLSVL